MSLVATCVAIATNAIWLTASFFWILWAQYKFFFRPELFLRWSCLLHKAGADSFPTLVAPPVLDDNGPPAARLLLSLGHALSSFIIRVIRSVDCHLLLNHPETRQLRRSTGEKEEEGGQQSDPDSFDVSSALNWDHAVLASLSCSVRCSSAGTLYDSVLLGSFKRFESIRTDVMNNSETFLIHFIHIYTLPEFPLAFKNRLTAARCKRPQDFQEKRRLKAQLLLNKG